ncbi:MAG: alkaline phosphatase family protein [Ignavibacteriae bacterium]|nr:alkaline phosphatase family protein [Ignavibacteriota bacterium]
MKSKNVIIIFFVFTSIIFAQKTPYVILISFDGFRWDYCERGITPNLDSLQKYGVKAKSLKPCFPSKTFPNHYSIITGMYPENHGIISNFFINPFTKEKYRLGDTNSVRNSKWYLGEAFWETARRNGIKTASYFWPGSEVDLEYRRPNYFKYYQHSKPYKERIDEVINWLKFPQNERPHFITLYFHDTDSYGHDFGPNSIEVNQSIRRLDSLIGYLNSELNQLEIKDSVNIILVSDHGMTEVGKDKIINIEEMLKDYKSKFYNNETFAFIEPSQNEINEVYQLLKESENHYKVYFKDEVPEHFHFSKHPFISSIIIIADLGWTLVDNKSLKKFSNSYSKGNHGFDNNELDMHGIFFAKGKLFKENYKIGTVQNIDINPLLAKIFGINPKSNIDGKLERIEFILK